MKSMVLVVLLVTLTSTARAEEPPCLTALETCVDYEPVTAVCHKDGRPLVQFYGKPDIRVCERIGGRLDVAPGWVILAQRVLIFLTGENHL